MGQMGGQVMERMAAPARVRLYRPPAPIRIGAPSAAQLSWLAAPAFSGWRATLKRTEDIAIAITALVVVAPFMLLVAAWIRFDSPGQVLFRQRRVGLSGREFQMLKFRTMREAAVEQDGCRQAIRGDRRVTRAGAWLRRTSFDELPQLFNVLVGEMSLVGPRPHAPGTCAAGRPFEAIVPYYPARHRVRPGMTWLAQVRGWRGETDTEEKIVQRVQSDLEYIADWTIWLDLAVLARTLGAMLSMKNAY